MIFLNIVLLIGVIGLLCWVVFTLAVYALPLFVGVTAGMWAHDSGAGIMGGSVVGVIAAGAVAIIGQLISSPSLARYGYASSSLSCLPDRLPWRATLPPMALQSTSCRPEAGSSRFPSLAQ